jgi:hypothetical protein
MNNNYFDQNWDWHKTYCSADMEETTWSQLFVTGALLFPIVGEQFPYARNKDSPSTSRGNEIDNGEQSCHIRVQSIMASSVQWRELLSKQMVLPVVLSTCTQMTKQVNGRYVPEI